VEIRRRYVGMLVAFAILVFGHLSRDGLLPRVDVQTRVKLWTVQSLKKSQALAVNATSSSNLVILLISALTSSISLSSLTL
jgi:hydroxyacyl-ACP dehydratase HTD2-like protein with hotdog domain